MSAIKKNDSKAHARLTIGKNTRVRIDKNMPDYSKDPVFVKKNEEATAFLKKHGLPEKIAKKIREEGK